MQSIKKKIKVLIVDDSILFRETLASKLSSDPGIEVVGTAPDPYSARDKILDLKPDVMTLDVELPRMNGIEFLKKLMPQYPMPVVVVSSISDNVFDALRYGAVDFVTKPDVKNRLGFDMFINELVIKIKIASTASVSHWKSNIPPSRCLSEVKNGTNNSIIAIGASTGGTEAIYNILKMLPNNMPGIVIVQHMPPVFTNMYAQRLNNSCMMEINEAKNGDIVCPGRVLIAPGDFHMILKKKGSSYCVECYKGEKVNGHCPSVDVLFDSVAKVAGNNAIGVILTGMGYDGAKGLSNMRRSGARTIGQDEQSCIVYGMPKAAFEIGAVEKQATLGSIAQLIYAYIE